MQVLLNVTSTIRYNTSMEEIEVKFLDIDVDEITRKLESLGAKKVFERDYRRKVYDYPDLRLNADNSWIRIRDEGDQVTLGYKKRLATTAHDGSSNDGGMEEVELIVSDFDKMALFLDKIGLTLKFYEENRRIRYELDDVEFDIDFWPQLNPYLEIEAKSWNDIDKAIAMLELNPDDKKVFSTYQVYQMNGIDPLDYIENTFRGMVLRRPSRSSDDA